jgi:ABC-type multidrug transport system fused ATPase/permease subunit
MNVWETHPHVNLLDYETDTVIQESLRRGLGNDVTLFTIAHRLQTIMDADKIVSSAD